MYFFTTVDNRFCQNKVRTIRHTENKGKQNNVIEDDSKTTICFHHFTLQTEQR